MHTQEILRYAQNDMLAKSQRLNLKTDFKWVASGKKLESKYLKIFIRVGENKEARVAVALSSKNFKKAVDRNRAKRVTSQAFQSIFHLLPSSINIIALPKTGVDKVKSGDLLLDLKKALQSIVIARSETTKQSSE